MSSNHRSGKRDGLLLVAALVGFGLWLASIGPVRTWAARTGQRDYWIYGVTPSFLAACTFACWQAFIAKSRPVASAAYAAVLVTATEVVQIFLARYTADAWDIVAGVVGATVALPLLLWRERRRRRGRLH